MTATTAYTKNLTDPAASALCRSFVGDGSVRRRHWSHCSARAWLWTPAMQGCQPRPCLTH